MSGVHPAIRITLLVVYAALLARASGASILALGVPLIAVSAAMGSGFPGIALAAVVRLKWLLASVAALYVGFAAAGPQGVIDGVVAGAERCAALALMVVAAKLLLTMTPRDELAGGLAVLAAPLGHLGLDVTAFARRLVGTLDRVDETAELLRNGSPARAGESRIAALGRRAAEVFAAVEARTREPGRGMQVPVEFGTPPWHQWLYPLAVAAVGVLAGGLAGG